VKRPEGALTPALSRKAGEGARKDSPASGRRRKRGLFRPPLPLAGEGWGEGDTRGVILDSIPVRRLSG